jgi:hypothetical protein
MQKRDKKRAQLQARKDKMDGEGEDAAPDDETSERTPGFFGDERIDSKTPGRKGIKQLIRDKDLVAYLDEDDVDEAERIYGINENTLRGWGKLRDAWLETVDKPEFADPAKLRDELNRLRVEQQGERPEEAGSGGLFKFFQKLEYQGIWREKAKGNQAEDALWAWVQYCEMGEEIESLREPIRFTPAHAIKSPRFFIFPKSSRASGKSPKNPDRPGLKSDHVPKMFAQNDAGEIVEITGKETWLKDQPRLMAFNAGVLHRTKAGLQPIPARIFYAAPRLRRDAIRGEGKSGLGNASMIQPMMEALGIAPEVPVVNFANCAVTLLAEREDDELLDGGENCDAEDEEVMNDRRWRIDLAFPVSVDVDKLQKHSLFKHKEKERWNYQKSGQEGYCYAQFNYSAEEPRHEIIAASRDMNATVMGSRSHARVASVGAQW